MKKITAVVFKEPEDAEQYFTISMQDQDYSIQDSGLFVADSTACSLWMGYVDNYDLMMDGIVQVVKPTFPRSGVPTLEITVKNVSSIMNKEELNESFVGKTYSEIAIEKAKKYGMKYDVDDTRYLFNPAQNAKANSGTTNKNTGNAGGAGSGDTIAVGSKVKFSGTLYGSSYGEGSVGTKTKDNATVTKVFDKSRKAPYQLDNNYGYAERSSLTLNAAAKTRAADTKKTTTEKPNIGQSAVYQTGKSDYEFLRLLAKKIGFRFYIDGNTLYFKKHIKRTYIEMDYRCGAQNLLEFTPNINTTNTGSTYKAENIDFNEQNSTVKASGESKTAEEKSKEPSSKTHTVKNGDYLIAIAKTYYGDGSRYKDIYNANTDKIKMPGYVIYAGTQLIIP